MTVTVAMTDDIFVIDGVECRLWEGRTENGNPVRLYTREVEAGSKEGLTELVDAGMCQVYGEVWKPVPRGLAT